MDPHTIKALRKAECEEVLTPITSEQNAFAQMTNMKSQTRQVFRQRRQGGGSSCGTTADGKNVLLKKKHLTWKVTRHSSQVHWRDVYTYIMLERAFKVMPTITAFYI